MRISILVVFLLGLGLLAACQGINLLNDSMKNRRDKIAQHNSDVKECRMLINIDPLAAVFGDSTKKLEMACAHEVIEAQSGKRSQAALHAYNTCMPKLDACDRVLIEK